MGKGEIACYKQFLLFPQGFQKTCAADTNNQGLIGIAFRAWLECLNDSERDSLRVFNIKINSLFLVNPLLHNSILMILTDMTLKNTVENLQNMD